MSTKKSIALILSSLVFVLLVSLIYISNQNNCVLIDSNAIFSPTLIIDAGHGGEDGGAVAADGFPEKDINLDIALQMQSLCALFGMPCIMTRTDDVDLADHTLTTIRKRKISDINARMNIMEENPQAYYIGIHQNLYSDDTAQGLQVFYSPNNDIGKDIANAIQSYTKTNLQPQNNRTIKAAGDNIYLLYNAQIPAVMVECGFISNPREYQLLKTKEYTAKVSLCILGGIIQYYSNERIT